MKTAHTTGCLLTAEVASGIEWRPGGSPGFCALPAICLRAGCHGSCHHICTHGRKQEEGAALLRSPLLSENEQLSRVPLTDFIRLFDLICSRGHFKLEGRIGRGAWDRRWVGQPRTTSSSHTQHRPFS